MHLERRSIHNLPPGAIIVSDNDAIRHYQNYLYGPKKTGDMWPFKYGMGITSTVGLFTGFWLTNHYVTRFRFTGKVTIFFYLIGAGMPALMSLGAQVGIIQPDILLQKVCTSCVYTKAVLVNNVLGVVYPTVPTAFIAMITAGYKGLCGTPGFNNAAEIKESFKFYGKVTQKIYPRILLCVILNSIAAIWVTSKQYDAFELLNKKLKMQDEKLRELAAEYELRMKEK